MLIYFKPHFNILSHFISLILSIKCLGGSDCWPRTSSLSSVHTGGAGSVVRQRSAGRSLRGGAVVPVAQDLVCGQRGELVMWLLCERVLVL